MERAKRHFLISNVSSDNITLCRRQCVAHMLWVEMAWITLLRKGWKNKRTDEHCILHIEQRMATGLQTASWIIRACKMSINGRDECRRLQKTYC
jgi:hypothetical protein